LVEKNPEKTCFCLTIWTCR